MYAELKTGRLACISALQVKRFWSLSYLVTVILKLQYDYYRKGLDEMANNAERGRTEITAALETGLKKAKENRPLSLLPQIWTDFKKDELANIYRGKGTQKEKESIYELLFSINPSQNKYWDQVKE